MLLQSPGFYVLWLMWFALSRGEEQKIFCYYQESVFEKDGHSKLEPAGIDPTLCTHLVYLTLGGEGGNMRSSNSQPENPADNYKKFNALRERNEKLKTLIAVGGKEMSEAMKDPSSRSKFIQNIVNFVLEHKFDGISIYDASLIAGGVPPNYNLHLNEIRAKFHEHNRDLILTITLKAAEATAKLTQNIPQISGCSDFVLLIMPIYSPMGATITRNISPLYPPPSDTSSLEASLSINATIKYWLDSGASAKKLILGTVFGGVSYTLKNSAEHVPGSPAIPPVQSTSNKQITPYNEICELISQDNWTSVWDVEQHMPYSYAGHQWSTYENARSLIEKAKYAKARGLGGVMAHIINSDDYRGHCGEPYPLLKALNCELYKNNCSSNTANQTTSNSVLPPVEAKILCYYDSTAANRVGYARLEPSEIDPSNCTHLIYAALRLNEKGKPDGTRWVDLPDNGGRAGFQKFNALRKRNEKLKTLLSTRAWHQDSVRYSRIYADTSLRSQYVKDVVLVVRNFEFDGLFIDWIYPNANGNSTADVQNFVLLLKELRAGFDEHKLILGATLRGSEKYARSFYDVPQISKYVDFVALVGEYHLTEDSNRVSWTAEYPTTRETAGLDWSINYHASIKYWLRQGAPPEKIILGTQFIGLSYTLNNSTERLLKWPANIPAEINDDLTIVGYNEICRLTSQDVWATGWNDAQHVPFSQSGDRWISYDNDRSLFEKGKYAKAMGLGGVMAWTIDQDDHRGDCGERYPLLNALNCGLREMNCTVALKLQITSNSRVPDQADKDAKRTCASLSIKYVRHPQNCGKFWICQRINGTEFNAEPFSCATGLYFDTSKAACRSKDLVQCS